MRRKLAFLILFMPFPLLSLAFVTIGVLYNNWILSNESIEMFIFLISLTGVTISSLYFIYQGCKQGIIFSITKNEWDKLGTPASVFIRLFLIIAYLLFSSFVFSLLYAIWGILSGSNVVLGIGDAFYYALSVVYSLPMSGIFEQFHHLVNSNLILRILVVLHIIMTRIIEFIVIGLILNQVNSLLVNNRNHFNKLSYRNIHLKNANKRRRKRPFV